MNKPPSLYFITSATHNQMNDDCDCNCDCDCDCACPTVSEQESSSSQPPLEEAVLFPSPGLQFYALDEENLILLGGKSSPAVLSLACFDLLNRFPARVKDAIGQMPAEWSLEHIQGAIRQMVRHGILSDKLAEQSIIQKDDASILTAWIHLTTQCNLACRYCYLPHESEKLAPDVGHQVIDAIVRSARAHHSATLKLKYAGGEPLLNFTTLIDNFRYAKIQAEKVGVALEGRVLTNGVLLDRNRVQQLKEQGLSLTISLDGTQTDHDAQRPLRGGGSSFALVARGIRLAMEGGLKPNISITLSGANANGLAELVAWLLDLDLHFTFNFYRTNHLSQGQHTLDFENRQIIDALLESYRLIAERKPDFAFWHALGDRVNLQRPHTRPCSVGKNYLVFDVHGNLASCQMAIATTLGNCHAPDPLAIVQAASSGPQNIPVTQKMACSDCEWKLWCAGGCPVQAKYTAGSHGAKSPYCEIYKAIIPVLLRMEAKSLITRQITAL